ncbi:alkaline phosphatase family protein [Microbacterium resistens]|uniref:alkaline phosphatase family protein n=1 Tax=Microbacterium resistens TaxID=156977 RepID=UPI001C56A3F8|nr:nucleotide pyrophosphatase/phosphodiesterase family protein [Microbacterium resistens]MBW1638885.1 alkaline phosphatase family protein [Microbacterium resistens]
MTLMLPAVPPTARSITGVAQDLLDAIGSPRDADPPVNRGEAEPLPAVRSAVLVVIDGLGAAQLRAHAGHARTLASAMTKRDVAFSVFPSTTASALTSLVTGVAPGRHGLVGYRVLDRERGRLVNQLSGWEQERIDPASWQREPTVFERARALGHPVHAVGLPAYARSGFSAATLRGADFHAAKSGADRVALALGLAEENDGALVYCYLPEADKAGHRDGVASAEWGAALEDIDAALSVPVPRGVGVLVTADHGMVDVPRHRHLIVDESGPMRDGVAHIGGEPRMLHVYLDDPDRLGSARSAWAAGTEGAADVLTRDEAIAGGLFGSEVTADAAARIGDLVIPARGTWALYDGAAEDQKAQDMVGQHGSLTPEELRVPLLRMGAFAR